LIGALCFTDTFTDDKLRAISLNLTKNTMTIAARSAVLGWAYETIPADLRGAEIEFGVNPAYLLEVVKSIPTASIALHANSSVQPIIVTPKEGDNPTALIMPVQIKGGK
jgi:DNA polymerase III subunit beta